MARLRSPEKRIAILQAATQEIAETGLGASTASIARRAGVASGSLFTYFATKDELLNELYFELKTEVYDWVSIDFPRGASLEKRALHLWTNFLEWAIEFPEKRKVSAQLNVSDLIAPATRLRAAAQRDMIGTTLKELEARDSLRGMPAGFAAAVMAAFQEAAMEFISRHPKRRKEFIERSFRIFWRAFQ